MKRYHVTAHAIMRAVERLGLKEEHVEACLNDRMMSAYYVGETHHGPSKKDVKIFDHHKSKTRMIIGDDNVIITVYPFPELPTTQSTSIPEAFADDIRQLVQRKFKAKEREFNRKHRVLEIELAEINLELAQLTLNQLKAKSPKARNSIAERMDEVKTKQQRIKYEIDSAVKSFEEMTKEVAAVCKH